MERRHASAEAGKQRVHASAEARADREHATAEAKAARRYALRLEGYKAASRYLERQLLWVQLTEPMMTPAAEPPKPMEPDEEWIEIGSTIAIAASDAVQGSMQAAITAQRAFLFAIDEARAYRHDRTAPSWDPGNPKSPNVKLEEAREHTLNAIKAAQTVMRDELADL